MNDNQQRREMIDAYPLGGLDQDQPEFAELKKSLQNDEVLGRVVARSQDWDRAVTKALVDVEVPAGLAERLLAGVENDLPEEVELAAGNLAGGSLAGGDWTTDIPADGIELVSRRDWLGRRAMLTVAAVLASAAALVAVVMPRGMDRHEIRWAQQFAESAPGWMGLVTRGFKPMAAVPASNLPPVNTALLSGWQSVDLPHLGTAICYQLKTGPQDFLFVIPAGSATVSATRPPVSPDLTTSGARRYCYAVWQNRGSVYVLVIEGSVENYWKTVAPIPPVMARATCRTATIA